MGPAIMTEKEIAEYVSKGGCREQVHEVQIRKGNETVTKRVTDIKDFVRLKTTQGWEVLSFMYVGDTVGFDVDI